MRRRAVPVIGGRGIDRRHIGARRGDTLLDVDPDERPSTRLVEQRIRNRIIEYLELAASFEAQREYDRDRIAYVPHEVIEQWADWNPVDQSRWPGRLSEPYSPEEVEAMNGFHAEWEWVIEHTPNPLPELTELQQLPAWERLRDAARLTLLVFQVRGRLPEDEEV